MYLTTLVTQPYELEQIAALSKENLRFSLSEAEKETQGFVTWNYTVELLQQLHAIAPSIIIKYNDKVVAYALTAYKESAVFQPEIVPMTEHLETLTFRGRLLKDYHYYIMGQVCIAKAHRGKGLFDLLYRHHKTIYQPQFEVLVTEVSSSNYRSLQAHKRIGFQTIDTYADIMDEWKVVVWDWE